MPRVMYVSMIVVIWTARVVTHSVVVISTIVMSKTVLWVCVSVRVMHFVGRTLRMMESMPVKLPIQRLL